MVGSVEVYKWVITMETKGFYIENIKGMVMKWHQKE